MLELLADRELSYAALARVIERKTGRIYSAERLRQALIGQTQKMSVALFFDLCAATETNPVRLWERADSDGYGSG